MMRARHAVIALATSFTLRAEIPHPDDAPKPLPPAEAAKSFHLPPGLTMELIASEPLIEEPSGVCWDERGRMIVCELHGYNVEGQYDVDELNKTGKLDMEVRRIQAGEAARRRAKGDNYGTVKLLLDTDADGVMDRAEVWADHLPLCYGVVPARGGVIVACPPDIVHLADRDGDGRAEVREILFTGFGVGQPERGVNAPTWGVDNWIYFGRGHSGGTITGPHLNRPVVLGDTDFRIRADGSAIEPVTGSTKTIGMTFTEGGDRFVTTTTSPGLFVTPIPPRAFERNPDAAAPLADAPAADYNAVFPLAPPHPWRTKREKHAEYFAFYKRISLSDAAASGYFTSACSPLVYQDRLMPELRGQYFVCEPAQNLVHRARIDRDGTRLRLKRLPQEQKGEFLASTDPWFHPIGLHHTPDGSIAIIDFYREIIEDYSAIPRHLQQQYGVINGHDRGRIWLLTKAGHRPALGAKMDALDDAGLRRELEGEGYWRRQTARRLLIEHRATPWEQTELPKDAGAALAVLYTLEGLDALAPAHLESAWRHDSPEVRRHALRLLEAKPDEGRAGIARGWFANLAGQDSRVLLQAALSLGAIRPTGFGATLATLARDHGEVPWMDAAVACSAHRHEKEILSDLAAAPGKGQGVLLNLAGIIASRGDAEEIAQTLTALESAGFEGKALDVLKLGIEETHPLADRPDVPAPSAPTEAQLAALEKRLPQFVAALNGKPDLQEGRVLFNGLCSVCHRSRGAGFAVGPDLDAEFLRAPEVILRDILFPHEALRPGFETVMAKTRRGGTLIGIAVSDSPTSITLRMPGGIERTILRKHASISIIRNVSLMLSGFGDALNPAQVASIIAFLRQPR